MKDIALHGPHGTRFIRLSPLHRFVMWVEGDAVQLGIALTTYYMICALWGAFNAMLYAWQIKRIFAGL